MSEGNTNTVVNAIANTTTVAKEPDPVVSARVPSAMRDRIDALRPLFPRPDGNETPRSDVLRAMLMQAETMFDSATVLAVRDIASARGCDVAEAWSWVIAEGLRVAGGYAQQGRSVSETETAGGVR